MQESTTRMRVKVVRTPGELRDTIGHKVMVRKDWLGTVTNRLSDDELTEAGFHPKRHEAVYLVLFDAWEQPLALSAAHLVEIHEQTADEGEGDAAI